MADQFARELFDRDVEIAAAGTHAERLARAGGQRADVGDLAHPLRRRSQGTVALLMRSSIAPAGARRPGTTRPPDLPRISQPVACAPRCQTQCDQRSVLDIDSDAWTTRAVAGPDGRSWPLVALVALVVSRSYPPTQTE